MYRTIRMILPPERRVAPDNGGPGRGFNQNGTVGNMNAAHHVAARKIGIFKAKGLSTPRKNIVPSAEACNIRAEMYPNVIPREEI